jgi:hypothetical protein
MTGIEHIQHFTWEYAACELVITCNVWIFRAQARQAASNPAQNRPGISSCLYQTSSKQRKDYYYAADEALFARTTVQAFQEAGAEQLHHTMQKEFI